MSDNETYDYRGVVCPHCEHRHSDPIEMTGNDDDEHERECSKCDKPFICWSSTLVAYCAKPIDPHPDGGSDA